MQKTLGAKKNCRGPIDQSFNITKQYHSMHRPFRMEQDGPVRDGQRTMLKDKGWDQG